MSERPVRGVSHGDAVDSGRRIGRAADWWLRTGALRGVAAGLFLAGCVIGAIELNRALEMPEDESFARIADRHEPPGLLDPALVAGRRSSVIVPVSYQESEPTNAARQARSRIATLDVPIAEPSLIATLPPSFDQSVCPTLKYFTARLAVAAPCRLLEERAGAETGKWLICRSTPCETWVRTVVLRKVSGLGKGSLRREPVHKGAGLFRDLTPGAYDVIYVSTAASELSEDGVGWPPAVLQDLHSAHRRIVIELDARSVVPPLVGRFVSGAVASGSGESSSPHADPFAAETSHAVIMPRETVSEPTSPPIDRSLRDLAIQRTARGWECLGRESLVYSAVEEFRSAVLLVGNARTALSATEPDGRRWKDLLEGRREAVRPLASGETDHAEVAAQLVRFLGDSGGADACYGLAKAYDAIARERTPALADAEHLAIVCYLAASRLDERLTDSLNDVAVLYHRLDRLDAARAALEPVASTHRHARYAYNMGRILWDGGYTYEAQVWWRKALERDPTFRQARFALVWFQLSEGAGAYAPEGCRALAENLSALIDEFGSHSPEGEWAGAALKQLEFLGYEAKLNSESFLARTCRPDDPARRRRMPDSEDRDVEGSGVGNWAPTDRADDRDEASSALTSATHAPIVRTAYPKHGVETEPIPVLVVGGDPASDLEAEAIPMPNLLSLPESDDSIPALVPRIEEDDERR